MNKIDSKQIMAVINSQSSSEHDRQTKSENERVKQERVMDRLWQRLQEIYGHQLNSQFGVTIPESWERLLTGLSPDQIKNGLEALATRTETWPPNAQEFRQLCLPVTISPDGNNTSAYLDFQNPAHPEHEHYGKTKQIEDLSLSSKRKKMGNQELAKIRGLFG